jgi:F-type H+-transporting ATPase subunit delta
MPHETALDIPKIADRVARTYAQSLFELSEEAGSTDAIVEELTDLIELMTEQPDLAALMRSPSITASKRASSLARLFKGNVSDLLYRFLQVLNGKRRLDRLPAIAVAFGQLVKDKHGEVDVELYTAVALSEQQIDRMTDRISQAIGRTALLHPHVDEHLIGGLKIQLGDRLIDGSVATQLSRLSGQMAEAGREAARQRAGSLIEE